VPYSKPTALAQAANAQFLPPLLCSTPKMIAEIAAPRLQIGSLQMARADYDRLDSSLAIVSIFHMQEQHATNTSAVGLEQVMSNDSRCKLAIVLMNGMLQRCIIN